MRTIKFLSFALALVVGARPTLAQDTVQPGAFPGVDRLARFEARRFEARRFEARRFEQRQWRQHFRGQGRMNAAGRFGRAGAFAGAGRGPQWGNRPHGAGLGRAGLLANATPEQKAFVEQLRAQREAVHAQVIEGKLTREQARTQMQAWIMEHRPKN